MDARGNILVADDDPELLASVAQVLEAGGATVTRARSGAELIEALGEGGPFSLVVTDVSMPWMTGVQAMHSSRYAGLDTPVIVMTALRDPAIPDRVRALGDRAVLLRKPFSASQLLAAVDALVPARGTAKAS